MESYFEIVKPFARKHPDEDIKLPVKATEDAAACDFFSPEDVVLPPHKVVLVWTDLKVILEKGTCLDLNVRSSMGKQPIMLANTQGWIDRDYANNPNNDGNIGLMFFNLGDSDYLIKKGDRIAQGRTIQCMPIGQVSGNERTGGFGSTGK